MQSMIAFAANMGNLVGSTFWTFVIYDARADACGSTGVFCPGSFGCGLNGASVPALVTAGVLLNWVITQLLSAGGIAITGRFSRAMTRST